MSGSDTYSKTLTKTPTKVNMSGSGAIPKTPTKTPTKVSYNVVVSPSSKITLCVLCCRDEGNQKKRLKLFSNMTQVSRAGKDIEKALDIKLDSLLYTATVCQACDREVARLMKKETEAIQTKTMLHQNYKVSLARIRSKFLKETTKRLAHSPHPSPRKPKKLAFGRSTVADKENEPFTISSGPDQKSSCPPSSTWVSVYHTIILLYLSYME
jgi:hypothetical protein